MRARRRTLLALLGVAALKGCLVAPYYSQEIPSRMNVEKTLAASPGFPAVGITTREELALRLGQPDLADERAWTYEWRKVVVVIPSCNHGVEITSTYGLRILFDERGIVREVRSTP